MKSQPTPINPITDSPALLGVIVRLAAPMVLMMYLQNAYNIIDTIWVGRLLGKTALAGIGTGGYVLWSLFGLGHLVSIGTMALVARRMGEGDTLTASQVASRGLRYALVLSVTVGLGVWFGLDGLFDLMGTWGEIRQQGLSYMRVLLIGIPLIYLSFTIQSIFQAAGDALTPMWLTAVSLALNAALDPLLMLGVGPFPEMGIAGAALATVLSRLVVVLVGYALLKRGHRLGLSARGFGPLPALMTGRIQLCPASTCGWDWSMAGTVARIGLPNAFSMTLFPFVYMVLIRIPVQYGAHQVAALRIGHTVEGMSFFLAIGCSMATATLVGQNLGAGKPQRAARAAWLTATLVAVVLAVFSLVFGLLPESIAAIFTPDPATVQASAVYLRILAFSQVFMGLEISLCGGFNGAGDTVPPMLVNVPLNLLRIPAAYWLANDLGWGVTGVWWAISGSTVLKGLLLAGLFASGRWARRTV